MPYGLEFGDNGRGYLFRCVLNQARMIERRRETGRRKEVTVSVSLVADGPAVGHRPGGEPGERDREGGRVIAPVLEPQVRGEGVRHHVGRRLLAVGGRLVIPVGPHGDLQELLVITKQADGGTKRETVAPEKLAAVGGAGGDALAHGAERDVPFELRIEQVAGEDGAAPGIHLGDDEAARGPLQQPHAQPGLERVDVARQA